MALFVAQHVTGLTPDAAWDRLTDWSTHARYVPLTTITVEPPPPSGVGTVFTARTALGRWGFDDPMEIVEWEPPTPSTSSGRCRIVKRGAVMHGWAELTVEPEGRGTRATWTEEISAGRLPRAFDGPTALSSRLLFTRVLKRLLEG